MRILFLAAMDRFYPFSKKINTLECFDTRSVKNVLILGFRENG
ncbi:hypothetical protein LEP1GSC052_3511 [Leptospira kmetyi serovar Malaysia str. Bejo-Iso9]|nr:hypothetical protein LEP1GSC052_3511 [Leptospira kmetyi serovar Malaysia str. Bejo-Iso9]